MRRLGHVLVLAGVVWSTTARDNAPRLMVSGFFFGVKPFPPDSRPVDGYPTEGDCKTALERHMTFLKNANDSYTTGQWKREGGNESVSEYFPTGIQQHKILQPFKLTSTEGKYDVTATIDGGGSSGQVEALRLGIARALVKVNAELKPALKKEGLMTRDPRAVERKKFGRKKARKRYQFSKR